MSDKNPNDQAGDPVAMGIQPAAPYDAQTDHSVEKKIPINDELPNEDHLGRIGELAIQLRNASPSGANTISDKILYHLNAIANPKEHNKAQASLKKTEDELEAERAADRAKNKTQPDKEKA